MFTSANSCLSIRTPASRLRLCIFFCLTALAIITPTASANNTVYTWAEDDGKNFSGALTVKGSAQAAGQIAASDIISFVFKTPDSTYNTASVMTEFFPIPISKVDAGFSAETKGLAASYFSPGVLHDLTVSVNSKYSDNSGENVSDTVSSTHTTTSGVGHWVITSVPEPSSLVLAIMAFAGGILYVAKRYGW